MTEGRGCVVTVTDRGGSVVVGVEGELDLATVSQLQEAIEQPPPGAPLIIDLTLCTFLDSSAVRALVAAARAVDEAGGSLSLVATDPGVLRVFEITAVDTMLPIHSTVEAAT